MTTDGRLRRMVLPARYSAQASSGGDLARLGNQGYIGGMNPSLLVFIAALASAAPVGPAKKYLKQAKDLDIPFTEVAAAALPDCPLSPELDEMDLALLELPVAELTRTEMKAKQQRADYRAEQRQEKYDAEQAGRVESGADVAGVAANSYGGMVRAGAGHATALAHSSQQAGFAAVAAGWAAEAQRHREKAQDFKAKFKEWRTGGLKFLCYYRQAAWKEADDEGNPVAVHSFLNARLLRRVGNVKYAASAYALGMRDVQHISLPEEKKIVLYDEAFALPDLPGEGSWDSESPREKLATAVRFHFQLPKVQPEKVRAHIKEIFKARVKCFNFDAEERDPDKPGYFRPAPAVKFCKDLALEMGFPYY